MLSINNVGSTNKASIYYENSDDYYFIGGSPSRWSGTAAKTLGLEGVVDAAMFANMLQGRLPNGVEIHNGGAGRRGGTDLTFSAPKSVSLMALIGGDKRLIEAHNQAVSKALALAEKYAASRITQDGITKNQITGNLIAAEFPHHISRACDPQLHTHCVVINATRRLDGEWRAMDNEQFYRNKMLLGALYRAELAREVQQLGYNVRLTHLDGRFELENFNDEQIRKFSQRSQAIEDWLRENKQLERSEANAWDKKRIAVLTRDKKSDVDWDYLHQEWQSTGQENGLEFTIPFEDDCKLITASRDELRAHINEAVKHLAERESIFSQEDLWRTTLELSTGIANFQEIESEIQAQIKLDELILSHGQLTTQALQQRERSVLDIEECSRFTETPILSTDDILFNKHLLNLSVGQQNAVKAIFISRNSVIGIQGRAGTGKTTLLQKAKLIADETGHILYGVAPSTSAARELGKSGIQSETISAFLAKKSNALSKNSTLVIDEAGMVSTNQMLSLFSEAKKSGCRIVLVGDTKQLKAVEAGKPFYQLQMNGMLTANVSQIQRQKIST